MKINFKTLFSFILFGTAASILSGFVFFGTNVFNLRSPLFQFLSFGVVGSVSFALFRANRLRDVIFANVLFFLTLFIASGNRFFLTRLFYFAVVVFSVFAYSEWVYPKLQSLKLVRPLILAGFFAICFLLVTLILTVLYHTKAMHVLPFRNMPIGFLIGLGLGIGFEISEYVIQKGVGK